MKMDDKFIDIERMIGSKNPKLLKRMPKFVIKYLKRKLHQKEINQIFIENEGVNGSDFCKDIIERFNIKVEVYNIENIPKTGGVIFASNHPLGGMDAMAIVKEVSEIRDDIRFIVNDLLLNIKNLKGMFVGVDKHSANVKKSLQEVDALFGSDKAVFLFPAGLVSRKKGGKIYDLTWKKTFVTRAKKHNKSIIPVYIDGELSNFFYRLANFREFIGIKKNIEMLYLSDELFKQKGRTIKLYFGEPIAPSTLDKSKNDKEWAKWIKQKAYNLPKI